MRLFPLLSLPLLSLVSLENTTCLSSSDWYMLLKTIYCFPETGMPQVHTKHLPLENNLGPGPAELQFSLLQALAVG